VAKAKRGDRNDLLGALQNPLRRQILRRMRDVDEISTRQLAEEFSYSADNMAHHVKVLRDAGAISVARQQPVRGSVKHFYRSTIKQPWAQQIIDLEPWDGTAPAEG